MAWIQHSIAHSALFRNDESHRQKAVSVNGEKNDLVGPSTNAIRGDFPKGSSLRLKHLSLTANREVFQVKGTFV